MSSAIQKLCDLGGPPLGEAVSTLTGALLSSGHALGRLLAVKNGFQCFESALHIFPFGPRSKGISLESWNNPETWRKYYKGLIDKDDLFFAQDAFGGQFFFRDKSVWEFDPETGSAAQQAPDIETWCAIMLLDWRVLSGYPLAHEWQRLHRPLRLEERLAPKIPFVMGGGFEVGNLYSADAISLMRSRADIALQLVDLEDGSRIRLVTSDSLNEGRS